MSSPYNHHHLPRYNQAEFGQHLPGVLLFYIEQPKGLCAHSGKQVEQSPVHSTHKTSPQFPQVLDSPIQVLEDTLLGVRGLEPLKTGLRPCNKNSARENRLHAAKLLSQSSPLELPPQLGHLVWAGSPPYGRCQPRPMRIAVRGGR